MCYHDVFGAIRPCSSSVRGSSAHSLLCVSTFQPNTCRSKPHEYRLHTALSRSNHATAHTIRLWPCNMHTVCQLNFKFSLVMKTNIELRSYNQPFDCQRCHQLDAAAERLDWIITLSQERRECCLESLIVLGDSAYRGTGYVNRSSAVQVVSPPGTCLLVDGQCVWRQILKGI